MVDYRPRKIAPRHLGLSIISDFVPRLARQWERAMSGWPDMYEAPSPPEGPEVFVLQADGLEVVGILVGSRLPNGIVPNADLGEPPSSGLDELYALTSGAWHIEKLVFDPDWAAHPGGKLLLDLAERQARRCDARWITVIVPIYQGSTFPGDDGVETSKTVMAFYQGHGFQPHTFRKGSYSLGFPIEWALLRRELSYPSP